MPPPAETQATPTIHLEQVEKYSDADGMLLLAPITQHVPQSTLPAQTPTPFPLPPWTTIPIDNKEKT